jgi:hypothetical protein
MGKLSDAAERMLLASAMIGALVFIGTIVYCADRLGWAIAIVIGWAPALVMAIISVVGYAAMAAIFAARSRWLSLTPAHPASASAAPISGAASVL